jgi:ribosomal protein L11
MIRRVNGEQIKSSVKLKTSKKEYPDLSFDQVKKIVEYRRQGMTEQEAEAKVKEIET